MSFKAPSGNCIYCGAQAYWISDKSGQPLAEYCPTGGCQAYHPHAYVAEQARLSFVGPPAPVSPGAIRRWGDFISIVDAPSMVEPPLYETTLQEKVDAGITLQHAQSVQEAWDRLEKKGYTLARRTKPTQEAK